MPRKSELNIETCRVICNMIAEGETLNQIFSPESRKEHGFPTRSTFFQWVLSRHPDAQELRDIYMTARETNGMVMGDKVVELARMVEHGVIDPNAARVAIDGYKWAAGNRSARHYGRRQEMQIGGIPDGASVKLESSDPRDVARRVAFTMAKGIHADDT